MTTNRQAFIVCTSGKSRFFATYERARAFAGPDGRIFKNLGGGIGTLVREVP